MARHPANGHERVTLTLEGADDLRKGRHRLGSVSPAIVHVNDRSRKCRPHHAVDNGLNPGKAPVPGIDRVAHRGQAALSDLIERLFASQAS